MNPNEFDAILFSGIPPAGGRRSGKFFTSLSIHAAAIGFLLLLSPQILLRSGRAFQFNTTLIAPSETKPIPRRAPAVAVAEPEPAARTLRPLPRVTEARISLPKLDQAPVLPKVARPDVALPVPEVAIRPAVQTGVFAPDAPRSIEKQPSVATARDAGFDHVKAITPAAVSSGTASAGFDVRSADSRTGPAKGAIQTGEFGAAGPAEARSSGFVAANVAHTSFDVQAESEKTAAADTTVRRTGFDEPKPVNAPGKQPVAAAVAALHPLQILDKPKPAYTAEARAEKIEGTVLLDVIFAATGEVKVMGVVRGLGHGLDQSAEDAARRIRFTPAMRSGAPVDQRVVLHVVFQITG